MIINVITKEETENLIRKMIMDLRREMLQEIENRLPSTKIIQKDAPDNLPLHEMPFLTCRVLNILNELNVNNLGELSNLTAQKIFRTRNAGRGTVNLIKNVLAFYGRTLSNV